ncbi:MAG: hypothetical protein IT423_02795, partial [Pirellulaceae bacterium]|nr:hypothetical protein [Pirellulaceae bacterium]
NIIGFDLLGLLDREPCSPFSRSQGMTMGEGAAFVTLERASTALNRGAPILAQLHGFAVTSDAFDAIQFDPSGDGIRRALLGALGDSGLAPEEIDWVKSSGAGGASQDASELSAIETTFGDHRPVVSSLESTYGPTNGAGPAMGLVTSVACARAGLLPATLNFVDSQSSGKFDFVPNHPREQAFRNFAATTAAFGGTNVVLVGGQMRANATGNQSEHDPIVISGIGLVTPQGCGTRDMAKKLLLSECQWSTLDSSLERFGQLRTAVQQVGLVRDFSAKKLLPSLRLRNVDLLTQFAAAATKLALQDAGLNNARLNERLGLVSGISRASGDTLDKLFEALEGPWASLSVSKALLRKGRFLVASQLANWFGCKGFTATITDGLSASLGALNAAAEQLRHSKDLQAIVVVAADEVSSSGLRLSEATGQAASGQRAYGRVYDPDSHGMILGEGAVAVVLERASDLVTSNRHAIATVRSVSSTFDALPVDALPTYASPALGQDYSADRALRHSWLEVEATGKWLAMAIETALVRSQCDRKDIGTIIGNACGVPAYDERERTALTQVFGREVQIESVNQHTGVLESACGLLSVAAASLCVQSSLAQNRQVATGNTNLAIESPTNALVCATSETGRNTAVILSA